MSGPPRHQVPSHLIGSVWCTFQSISGHAPGNPGTDSTMFLPSGSSRPRTWHEVWVSVLLFTSACHGVSTSQFAWPEGSWSRHTIDDTSRGADGVRLADFDGDGRLDVVSPWEQGGRIRIYRHPGNELVRTPWPFVEVGAVDDPEDAFLVDLDEDGVLDVVSSCEGETRSIFIHWAPADRSQLMDSEAWTTEELPVVSGRSRWMYAFGMQVDGRNSVDLVAGGKGDGAQLGWFETAENPRDLASWNWHPLYEAGWLMTLRPYDMDADGDRDILATDRFGPRRGAFWLENPGADAAVDGTWAEHRIGPVDDHEAMHNAIADLDGDGLDDVLVAVKNGPVQYHRRIEQHPARWETHVIAMPEGTGTGKSVQVADVDMDGRSDLIVACEHATEGRIGVFWMSSQSEPVGTDWSPHSISGPEGFIYDLLELVDIDADGDLDVLTLEEKGPYIEAGFEGRELGVIWYENPTR